MKQKDYVVDQVKTILGNRFVPGFTIAITTLTTTELETIKVNTADAILNGTVEYSKDLTNIAEVKAYARSMTMNHLKKAKELNGGVTATIATSTPTFTPKAPKEPKGIVTSLLSPELQDYIKQLF